MNPQPILCYITDRNQFPGTEQERRKRLLSSIAEAARSGVQFIQLREKDLSVRELEGLARHALAVIRENAIAGETIPTRLLVNSRIDVAIALRAGGVHLRSDDISIAETRSIVAATSWKGPFSFSASCHSVESVKRAAAERADFVVFAPVFEKSGADGVEPAGLQKLAEVCRLRVPVLALGGVNLENATACIHAGASGIAGIRLFQQSSTQNVVEKLRTIV